MKCKHYYYHFYYSYNLTYCYALLMIAESMDLFGNFDDAILARRNKK